MVHRDGTIALRRDIIVSLCEALERCTREPNAIRSAADVARAVPPAAGQERVRSHYPSLNILSYAATLCC